MTSIKHRWATAIVALTLGAVVAPVFAAPPAHAPAHGWRKKNDPYYRGYTGQEWPADYGVSSGSCNRQAVGTALGALAGGAIGSQIGSGDGRTVAIIAGTILGGIIGNRIGRDMDRDDRGCFGHSLELGREGTPVRWANPSIGVSYTLTPTSGFTRNGQQCRNFTMVETRGGKNSQGTGKACRDASGEWRIIS